MSLSAEQSGSSQSATQHGHCGVATRKGHGFCKRRCQCCCLLEVQTQTGEELAKINRRHAAIANGDDVISAFVIRHKMFPEFK